eukprot:gene25041-biopygen10374
MSRHLSHPRMETRSSLVVPRGMGSSGIACIISRGIVSRRTVTAAESAQDPLTFGGPGVTSSTWRNDLDGDRDDPADLVRLLRLDPIRAGALAGWGGGVPEPIGWAARMKVVQGPLVGLRRDHS